MKSNMQRFFKINSKPQKRYLLIVLGLFVSISSYSQVSIGASVPSTSANLDVTAIDINGNKRGLLIPRLNLLNTTDATTITNGNVNSLLVFNEATQADVTPGFYYWYINKWERVLNNANLIETPTVLSFDVNTGILNYVNEQGNNPPLNLSSLKIEPWQVEQTSFQATTNTQNIYQIGNVGIGTNDMLNGVTLDVRGAVRGGTGNSGAVGTNSAAFGTNNTASGTNSSATGINNTVIGNISGAIGNNNIVNTSNSMAIGINNVLNAEKSFTVGEGNVLSGLFASAMGRENIVDGENAVAHGVNNQSLADYTYTLGVGNISGAMGSMVFGRYNVLTGGNPTNFQVPLDPYFQLANGTSEINRSNIITVLKNGKTGFGNMNTPQATIHVLKTGTDITPAIIEGCSVFADNAAATAAGVPVGGLYRTATGVLMVRY
jgi:hypothetical protein